MKRRIFLGLLPLLIVIAIMGVYAIVLFAKLGSRTDVILRENYRSVLAGQQMKETAERMDSGLLFALAGEEDRGRSLFQEHLPTFRENLGIEMGNITVPGEQELADEVKRLHEEYAADAGKFWQAMETAQRRTLYFGKLLPTFTRVKDTANEIIRINQENMVKLDRDARDLSQQSTRYMIVAVLGGIAIGIYFAARLQRAILAPIQTVTAVSRELGEGKLDQVVPVTSDDELGQLADAFNKMATKLRGYRQAAGDQIIQARQMTEITFSAFPDPIFALSGDGRINFTNPAAAKFLYHLGLKDGLPPGVQHEVDRVLQGAPDYLPAGFERVLVFRVNEQEIFMLPRIIGMRDPAGFIFGVAVILQDITRLRLLDEVKSNLVSTVSHELKTPLTSVRMGLHLLLEERIGSLNGKQTELLLAARDDSERLLRMINDLLDLAKLESGKTGLPGRPMQPQALVDGSVEDLRALVESRGSHLVVQVAPHLPDVCVDLGQIAHVFSNLVSNAVKHTKPGDDIEIHAVGVEGKVRFSVIDHGPGIAPEFQSHLFDRFFRVPGSDVTGAGLGLAIAKEIIQAQGGRIGVQSRPGKGSEFYFDLPPAQSEEAK